MRLPEVPALQEFWPLLLHVKSDIFLCVRNFPLAESVMHKQDRHNSLDLSKLSFQILSVNRFKYMCFQGSQTYDCGQAFGGGVPQGSGFFLCALIWGCVRTCLLFVTVTQIHSMFVCVG